MQTTAPHLLPAAGRAVTGTATGAALGIPDAARTTLTWLDVGILVVVLLAAIGGWHRGRLSDAASSLGHLAGALAGFLVAMSWVLPQVSSPVPAWILLGVLTLFGALLGGAIGRRVAGAGWSRPGPISAALAAVLAAASALGVCWAAVQVAGDLGPHAAARARDRSAIVTTIDRADPAAAADLQGALRSTGSPTFRSVRFPEGGH